MSDLDESDTELDPEYVDKEDKEDKEDKDIVKPITSKKLISEYHVDSEDEDVDDVDDDDDDDDDVEDDDETDNLNIEQSNVIGDIKSTTQDLLMDYPSLENKVTDTTYISPIQSDVESDEEDYLQKFDMEERDEYVDNFHPECLTKNAVEIEMLTKITRDENNYIIDENHKTQPFLSKYEKTRILGQRAKQINVGDKPYINVPNHIIDGYLIAQLELQEKKIPVIIRRPLPGGKSEYWKLRDLELL